jgi:EAL domain-containing protein (putative c-di-GMP-specific phosphodiesterase class I)
LVCPDEFIPVAEDSGLIIQIGEWVLRQACHQIRFWQRHYAQAAHLTINVNLAIQQIKQSTFLEQLESILTETHLDGQCLKLEITESMLIDNTESTNHMLAQIRAKNIQLSIDDFGTGYSSLSYLQRFPVNTLKIDRSFIDQITSNEESEGIVQAVITLAHTLKMDVVAEGVETARQLEQLSKLGCDFAQGYFFARPMDAEAATAIIREKI